MQTMKTPDSLSDWLAQPTANIGDFVSDCTAHIAESDSAVELHRLSSAIQTSGVLDDEHKVSLLEKINLRFSALNAAMVGEQKGRW